MLKYIVSSLEDVAEEHRGLYKQTGDKFVLQVEGVKTQADIDRLQNALNNERAEHTKTKNDLKEVKASLEAFTDIGELDDLRGKLERLETIEAAGNAPELTKNFETVVQQRVASIVDGKVKAETTKLQRQIDALTSERDTAVKQNSELQSAIETREIGDSLRAAMTAANVNPASVGDFLTVALATGKFKLVDGKAQTEDGITPEQWVEDKKKTSPYYWPVAKGAGGQGESHGATANNPWSADHWSVTEQTKLVRENKAKAEQLAKEVGSFIGAVSAPVKK